MKSKQSGFTLVEIAIVLVIVGLLLGGVLKGQELITSGKAKALYADKSAIQTAYNTYKQTFPPVMLAGMFGHGADATLLEFADNETIQEAPKVSFQ